VEALEDVEDEAYPPQQKSFAMFKWMEAHVGSRYILVQGSEMIGIRIASGSAIIIFITGPAHRR